MGERTGNLPAEAMDRARLLALCSAIASVGALVLPTQAVLAASHTVAAGGTWHGTAEGILVDDSKSHSGNPPDDLVISSVDNYQVELSFSFSVDSSGTIAGTGNGFYTDAHWHLEGHNGKNGDFSCDPPVDGKRFPVVVTGHANGNAATLSLAIPDATETNDKYDCGADFSGFATTSNYMADSLALVGGGNLNISLTQPTSLTLPKTVSTSSGGATKSHVHIWSISVTPPGTSSGGGGGGGKRRIVLAGVVRRQGETLTGEGGTTGQRLLPSLGCRACAPVRDDTERREEHGRHAERAGGNQRDALEWMDRPPARGGGTVQAHRRGNRLRNDQAADRRPEDHLKP